MKITVVPNVVSPIVNVPENMSIVKSAILFGSELSKLEVSRVTVCGFPHIEGNGSLASDPGSVFLYLWRPGDLISKPDMVARASYVFMLFHEQDKLITDFDKLARILNEKKVFMFNGEFANWVRANTSIKVDTAIEHPVEPVPERLDLAVAGERIKGFVSPQITLWVSPSVRKNSLEGFFGCLDAIALYREPVTLNVISNITSGNLRDSLELFHAPSNADVREHPNPTHSNLYEIISSSHIVVVPSIDEGYHLPIYESARFGCAVVCSDIPANRQARKRNPGVILVPLYPDGLVCGHPHEEISSSLPLGNLDYVEFVSILSECMSDYRSIAARMGEYMRKGHPRRQMWSLQEGTVREVFGLVPRRSPGRAPVVFL